MVYLKRHQLKRHLYFCHIADPEESLSVHGISGQLIEQLGYECRGSSFEYAWVRTDFERYCEAHESDKQAFLNFFSLNKHYEEKWFDDYIRKEINLIEDHKKSLVVKMDPDDDNYITKIVRTREGV
jgi:hypothetical protein